MREFFAKFFAKIKELLFPADIKCICCDKELTEDTPYGVCRKCVIPLNNEGTCEKCGIALNNLSLVCNRCKSRQFTFIRAYSALIYEGEAERLIRALKFGKKKYLAKYLAAFMADKFKAEDIKCELVVPVPLSKERLKERGFNQAEELAKGLCGRCGLVMDSGALKKIRNTDYQAKQGFLERQANIKGAFTVDAGRRQEIKGKTVLLIDDLLTTGSTADECAKVLLKGGAKQVVVLTLATPRQAMQLY